MNSVDQKALYLAVLLIVWIGLDWFGIKDADLLMTLKALIGGIGIYTYHTNVMGGSK